MSMHDASQAPILNWLLVTYSICMQQPYMLHEFVLTRTPLADSLLLSQ